MALLHGGVHHKRLSQVRRSQLETEQLAKCLQTFLSDPGVPGVRSMGPDVSPSVTERLFADLTDVTLADEDNNSIPTDDVNRTILGNVAMQVAPPDGQN